HRTYDKVRRGTNERKNATKTTRKCEGDKKLCRTYFHAYRHTYDDREEHCHRPCITHESTKNCNGKHDDNKKCIFISFAKLEQGISNLFCESRIKNTSTHDK